MPPWLHLYHTILLVQIHEPEDEDYIEKREARDGENWVVSDNACPVRVRGREIL